MLAERFGGYRTDPGEPGLARISNHPFAQAALDGDVPVEAYMAALGALDDQLDLNLYLSHLRQARDEVVRAALRLIAGDRARHVGALAAGQDARVGSADRYHLGGAPSRTLHGRAAFGCADVLESAHVGRVRRDLREPGAAAALLSGTSASRSTVLLHDADHG